jgi:glutamyl-tRNA synthetase
VVFNWLFARQHHGKFILRIEDTDRRRYAPDAVKVIKDSLRWLGLDWDEGPDIGGPYGPYVQSQRVELYREKAEELIEKGWAYRCNCTPERLERVREEQRARVETPMYDGHCRNLPPDAISPDEPHVIRLKVPREGTTTVHDSLRGDIIFENRLIDDQVLLKSDGFPTYHLAVVVDDHTMGITHIMRGDDWISSTPKRVLLYQALGWKPPIYAHVPLVLGTDGKKLSKRHGAVSIADFRKQGYLPDALFNFLALLGWSPGEGEEQEIFSREELLERFDITHVNLATEVLPTLETLAPLVQERLKTLRDVVLLTDFIFNDIETPPAASLIGKKMTAEESLAALRAVHAFLGRLVDFDAETMEPQMRQLATELGLKAGQLFNIVRVATSNKKVAPPLFGCLEALGRKTTLQRLARAREVLSDWVEEERDAR